MLQSIRLGWDISEEGCFKVPLVRTGTIENETDRWMKWWEVFPQHRYKAIYKKTTSTCWLSRH